MLLLAIRTIPRAASVRSTPSFWATSSRARLTAAISARISPPARKLRSMRPSAMFASVVGGTGLRACRLRADVQLAEVVDPRDRAAAAADLDQVDDRDHDRVAGGQTAALDPVVRHDLHVPALDQRALGRRPADVEREHVRLANQATEFGGAPEAARRPRLDHRDRDLARLLDRVDAAVRLHDVELPAEAAVADATREAAQVSLRDRLHVGGEDDGRGALVLPPLARDLV